VNTLLRFAYAEYRISVLLHGLEFNHALPYLFVIGILLTLTGAAVSISIGEKQGVNRNSFLKKFKNIFYLCDTIAISRKKRGEKMRKQLKRDAAREALTRIEEAARTEKDFEELAAEWSRWEANAERGYAEPYDWLKKQFKDWALIFCASVLCIRIKGSKIMWIFYHFSLNQVKIPSLTCC